MHTFTKNKDGVTSLDQGVAPQLVYRYFLEDMLEKARFGAPDAVDGLLSLMYDQEVCQQLGIHIIHFEDPAAMLTNSSARRASQARMVRLQKCKTDFTIVLLNALPNSIKTTIGSIPPHQGIYTCTVEFIMTYLRQTYGIMTAANIKTTKAQLFVKHSGGDVHAHLDKFLIIPNQLSAAGQPMSQLDLVDAVFDSLSDCRLFDDAIHHYRANPRTALAVNQSVTEVIAMLRLEYDAYGSKATSKEAQYSAAAVAEDMIRSMQSEMAEMRLTIQHFSAAASEYKPTKWCHSHGYCKHDSNECDLRSPGHSTTVKVNNGLPDGGALPRPAKKDKKKRK